MSSAAKPAAKTTAKPSASAAKIASPAAASKSASSKPAGSTAAAAKPAAAKSSVVAKTGVTKPDAASSKTAAKGPSKSTTSPGSPTKKAPAAAAKAPVKQLTEEEIRRSEEEAAARKAAEAAEHERRNGSVLLRYNHYKENFTLKDGTLSIPDVDDRFSLSFAFPKCKLHMADQERSAVANIAEDPGVFKGLETGKTYWVLVEEDDEEARLSEERQKKFVERMNRDKEEDSKSAAAKDRLKGERLESCSCIEGNPCADQYCCKDWKNRFEVAKKNGWKGFS